MRTVEPFIESFPVRGRFAISRGSRTEAVVIRVAVHEELSSPGDVVSGYGECVPYAHYGETPASVVDQIHAAAAFVEAGADRELLQDVLAAGAARNALDCALWDLEAKRARKSVYELTELERVPVQTLLTIGLDEPPVMAEKARKGASFGTLKLKVGAAQGLARDLERVTAVRDAAPDARIVVDANEGWSPDQVPAALSRLADLGVALVEQPVPAGKDGGIGQIEHPVPLCADESFHTLDQIEFAVGRYEFINIKLDKTGGLTQALACIEAARDHNLGVMVGCMLSTSLSIAPALLVAQQADVVDVDGPYLLDQDRSPALELGSTGLIRSEPALWGS